MLSVESSTVLPVSQFSVFPSKPNYIRNRALPFRPWKQKTCRSTSLQCHKMFVPGFGEASPEAQGAKHLHDFFTFIAVKIVTAQLEDYNREAHADLMQFLENHSLADGDKFVAELMRESPMHKTLALRILEVRSAYCKKDFEWDNLKRLTSKMVDERNTRIMRDYVSETIIQ